MSSQPLLYGAALAVFVALFLMFRVFCCSTAKVCPSPSSSSSSSSPSALKEKEYQRFPLVSRVAVSPNSYLFRFSLFSEGQRLGLPTGKHIFLRIEDPLSKAPISRAYTPVSNDKEKGYFELLVKVYPQGKMGQFLLHLPLGESVEVRGPMGQLEYAGKGLWKVAEKGLSGKNEQKERKSKQICMIAGGSGITPMFQVLKSIAEDAEDKTECFLLYGNVAEEDILLKKELDQMAEKRPNLHIFYSLDKPSPSWQGLRGFITAEAIQRHFPAPQSDSLVLLCGPKPMCQSMEKNLKALDFEERHIFSF